jgi:hypothetical protein
MKTFIGAGIGDAFCMDSILNQSERDSITEIYWGCKYGRVLAPIFEKNTFYPNLVKQYIMEEENVIKYFDERFGQNYNHHGNPRACSFWHFKNSPGDYNHRDSFNIAAGIFGINLSEINQDFSPSRFFLDPNRKFDKSTFIELSKLSDFDWEKYNIEPNKYILMQHSSDNRPKSDIGSINDRDWEIAENISKERNLPVVIITDRRDVQVPLSNYIILNVFDFPLEVSLINIVALCKYCSYYIGLDSYVGILASKVLTPDNLYVKSYNRNITDDLSTNVWLHKFFMPHSVDEIKSFYVHQR